MLKRILATINEDLPAIKADLGNAESKAVKAEIMAGMLAKALVTLLFCVLFVVVFIALLGQDNAIVGVVVLLSVLTFQKVHFGYSSTQGAIALFFVFVIFAIVPPLAAGLGGITGALLNFAAILTIVTLACDRVEFQNHIVLVLSYLLLYGYPVDDGGERLRIIGLLVGGLWAASILYRKNRANDSTRTIIDVVRGFRPRTKDDEWKLKLAILIPLAMLVGEWLGLERTMWIGIAAMSVLSPYEHLRPVKMFERFLGTVLGSVLFYLLTLIPGMTPTIVGLSGGFLVGLTTSYKYQTVFNSLGALSVAMLIMGPEDSIFNRIVDNAFAIVFVLVVVLTFDWIADTWQKRGGTRSAS